MAENISPEEKLLRLIRRGKKDNSRTAASSEALSQKLLPGEKNISARPLRKITLYPLGLKRNHIILLISAACFLYTLSAFVYPLLGYKNSPPIKLNDNDNKNIFKKGIPPFEDYLSGIQNNRIFTNPAVPENGKPVINAAVEETIKDLNLIGIVSGTNPQAILENKSIQKTYYLSKGQGIGGFIIEDIEESKIILSHNGQRYELHL